MPNKGEGYEQYFNASKVTFPMLSKFYQDSYTAPLSNAGFNPVPSSLAFASQGPAACCLWSLFWPCGYSRYESAMFNYLKKRYGPPAPPSAHGPSRYQHKWATTPPVALQQYWSDAICDQDSYPAENNPHESKAWAGRCREHIGPPGMVSQLYSEFDQSQFTAVATTHAQKWAKIFPIDVRLMDQEAIYDPLRDCKTPYISQPGQRLPTRKDDTDPYQ